MNKTKTEYKKALKELTSSIILFEEEIGKEMLKPSTAERGKRIAKLLNNLTLNNQIVMRFTLGYTFKKINKLYSNVKVK